MIKNYIIIALRNLVKHKGYSIINILGLVMGLSVFILISLYVNYEFSYDKYHARSDRIYRIIQHQPEKNFVNSDYFAFTQGPLGPTLMEKYPEVISAVRLNYTNNVLISYGNKSFIENDLFYADQEVFEIFSINLLKGNPSTALNDPGSVIISDKMAEKYFGNKDPIGEIIKVQDSVELEISGVLENMPQNSHFRMEFILPFEAYIERSEMNAEKWSPGWYCLTYVLLANDADPIALEEKLVSLSAEVFKINNIKSRLVLQSLNRIHLYSNINGEISNNGDIKYVILLSSIALLILLIACINYMNLETARSARRGREVGIRKIVGAQKKQLIMQFLGESTFLTILSFGLSILVVEMILPVFNAHFERNISLSLLSSVIFLLFLFALILFTSLVSGSYLALLISSFKPIAILRGTFTRGSKGTGLRNVLVVFQFTVSIILIICTLVVRNQLKFIQKTDVGYSKDQIVVFRLQGGGREAKNLETIKNELLNNSQILKVSASSSLPNRITSFNRVTWPECSSEPKLTMYIGEVDYEFCELYDIKIVSGRNFSRDFPSDAGGVILINEAAAKALKWKSPLGRRLSHWNGRDYEIVGIVKDYNFHSLHSKIEPMYLILRPNISTYLSVKISGYHIPETIGFIKGEIKKFSPQYPFVYNFFDDVFDRAYRAEQEMGKMFIVYSGMAIFIACLGLLGLVAFTVENRIKEIGIRKVLGASVSSIINLLSRQFLKCILLSNIISWPIGYYAMNKWLQRFAYRVNLNVWIFIISGLAALIIALLTVSYRAIKAATANPVDSLRYE